MTAISCTLNISRDIALSTFC